MQCKCKSLCHVIQSAGVALLFGMATSVDVLAGHTTRPSSRLQDTDTDMYIDCARDIAPKSRPQSLHAMQRVQVGCAKGKQGANTLQSPTDSQHEQLAPLFDSTFFEVTFIPSLCYKW